ncbi:MAG: PilZ domain-containing protein [Synergistetes bacterium]|nr:PilZ domain-containing protein [Synergistota bacterium]
MKVKLGSRVFFEIEGGTFKGTFPTRIEDMNRERGLIAIAHPLYKGVLIPLRGERYYIWLATPRGIYRYPVSIVGAEEDRVPLILLKVIGQGEHLQRRRFVRVETNLPLSYRLKGRLISPKKGRVKDISAGGIKGVFEEPLVPGQRILIRIDLGDGLGPMILEGRVVRVEVREGEIEHGVEFISMSDKAVRRIMRYVFKIERDLRQKGLL